MREGSFPQSFVWGAATSSYQIEGAVAEGGRAPSIWDTLARRSGAIADGTSGEVACDHYHRWRTDIELMRRIGLQAYRFSVAWPRVMPTGSGPVNAAGLDFYDRLVDALLDAGITPYVTLYHWDLPQALQDEGGWPSRATAEAFVAYTDVVSHRLGDRVKHWITHNEPWCVSYLGYVNGEHAPARRGAWPQALAAAHHLLLSHGWATETLRRRGSAETRVGIALNLAPAYPASPSLADREACTRVDGQINRWFLDPMHGRGYPHDVIADHLRQGVITERDLHCVCAGDLAAIAQPYDFLGVNYYSRAVVRSDRVAERDNEPRSVPVPQPESVTDMGWEVHPEGLHALLLDLHRTYAPPSMVLTENGAAYDTAPDQHGRVNDSRRIAFLRDHIDACRRAIDEGVPVDGYFVWSLLDNFEWAHGYTKRFGLVWVDYQTQERILKDSARWYAEIIRAHSRGHGLPQNASGGVPPCNRARAHGVGY